jgi:hypothetical protein
VGALHRDFLLMGPCAAELTLGANQKSGRIAIDEQCRNRTREEPVRIEPGIEVTLVIDESIRAAGRGPRAAVFT